MKETVTSPGRTNQKARTRSALVQAAVELVREGRPPSIPDAADRALISVATAYRYFPTADELWFEASAQAVGFEPTLLEADQRIEGAGDDPVDRLEALVRSMGFAMVDDQAPFRRLAKGALEQWFNQVDVPIEVRAPMRQGRRNEFIATVLAPLRGRLPDAEVDRIAHALGVVVGTDVMLALTDGVGLEGDEVKQAMLDAARWMLTGALAELDPPGSNSLPEPGAAP
jgi:AcrR family transcriptional regulator